MSGLDLVIFGATGDLSARKLFPALCQLDAAGLLPDDLRIVAVARQDQTTEAFHEELRVRMAKAKRQSINDVAWQKFVQRLAYLSADFSKPEAFRGLQRCLSDTRISLFYLATPPSLFSNSLSSLLPAAAAAAAGGARCLLKLIRPLTFKTPPRTPAAAGFSFLLGRGLPLSASSAHFCGARRDLHTGASKLSAVSSIASSCCTIAMLA